MKYTITFAFLFIFLFTGIYAQDPPSMRYKNEFGIDVSGFAFTSFPELFPDRNLLGLMYKRRYNKNFLRVGIGGSFQFENQIDPSFNRSSVGRKNLEVRLGYERMIPFARRFAVNLGIDAYGEALNQKSRRIIEPLNTGQESVSNSYTAGIEPFAGLEIYFFKRISVGFESGIRIFYAHSESIRTFHNYGSGEIEVLSQVARNSVGFGLRPFETVSLNIHF